MHYNSEKTHCKNGHELTEVNTYTYSSGKRGCKECRRIYMQNWAKNNPEKILAHSREKMRSLGGKFSNLKAKAKRRNLPMFLTFEDYKVAVSSGVCYYCGGELSDAGYSLDRVDHLLGYYVVNVVACCGVKDGYKTKSCNFIKGRLEGIGFSSTRAVELLMELLGK